MINNGKVQDTSSNTGFIQKFNQLGSIVNKTVDEVKDKAGELAQELTSLNNKLQTTDTDSTQKYNQGKIKTEYKLDLDSNSQKKPTVEEAEDYFKGINELEPYMTTAHLAVKEVRETRKLYFPHYSAILQFVEFQRKLNQKTTDDDYIVF